MSNEPIEEPVTVTGEARRHPAYRLLARAVIALARLRLRKHQEEPQVEASEPDDQAEQRDA